MKRLNLIFALLGCAAAATAADYENCFKEGTVWYHEGSSMATGERVEYEYSQFIGEPREELGRECYGLYLRLYDDREPGLETVVRTEGDKVYFLENAQATEWKLMFDFGVVPGETVDVAQPSSDIWESGRTATHGTLRCVSASLSDEWGGYPALLMALVDPALPDGDESYTILWLKGVGSEEGPTDAIPMDGVPYDLKEVTTDGKTVRRMPPAGISEAGKMGASVSVSGRSVTFNNLPEGTPCVVYTPDGRLVAEAVATAGQVTVAVPAAGYYLASAGSHTRKILAR